jgi:hypothetical protein
VPIEHAASVFKQKYVVVVTESPGFEKKREPAASPEIEVMAHVE